MNVAKKPPTVIRCKKSSDIPKETHWAIIDDNTVYVSGYDPGDADVPHHHVNYTAYLDRNEWETEVASLTRANKQGTFTAMEVKPAVIQTTVNVTIS